MADCAESQTQTSYASDTDQLLDAQDSCCVINAGYIMQGTPGLGTLILKRIGPKRARAMKAGGSGYDVSGMLRRSD